MIKLQRKKDTDGKLLILIYIIFTKISYFYIINIINLLNIF